MPQNISYLLKFRGKIHRIKNCTIVKMIIGLEPQLVVKRTLIINESKK